MPIYFCLQIEKKLGIIHVGWRGLVDGFIFQSNEIYGGLQGLYDYGPLGVELKNNLKSAWWKSVVYNRDDVEGLDTSILTHPDVLKYSGHEDTFTDPLVDCKSCGLRFRQDQIAEQC